MSPIADRVISYEFRARYANMQAGLTSLSKSTQDLGAKLTATDKQGQKMRAGLSQLGGTAGKVSLVAAAGLGAIVAVTAKFESAMSRVGAATRASGDDLGKLRQAAIDLGADTIFSATEAADGITELGKAGLSTADILSGGLKGALDLAAAGQISVSDAAATTATTLSQFGLAGDQASRVADTLTAASNKALGSVDDMAGALKYVGPVAAQMGISLEETSGAIAELASQGILGEQAGTSLRGMLTSLTSPSKVAAQQMEALGITMYDAQGKFIGIDGVAGQLQETMGGLEEADRNEALGRIFGNEQITAARVLYAGGAGAVEDWTKKVTDSGAASEQAAKLTDNLSGDLEQLKGSLESALIGSGEGSQGPLRSLTQGLTKVVDGFNELPSAAKSGVTGLLAITAVTGGAAWFGAKVIGGIANTKQALEDLGISAGKTSTSLGRVARTGTGLIALAGAVTVLSSSIGDAFGASLDTSNLQRDLEALADGRSKDVLKRITEDLDILGQTGGKITEPLHEVETLFGTFGDTGLDKAANNIDEFDQALAGLVESGNADQAKAVFDQLLAAETGGMVGASYSPEIIDNLMSSFSAYGTALENAGTATATTDGLTSGLTDATGELTSAQSAAFQTGEEYAAAQKAIADALKESRAAAGDTANAIFGVGDSVDDAKVSLDGWITDLEKQGQALRDFRKNAEDAADKGLRKGLISALEDAGPAGALRLQQLADATDTQIKRANKAWKAGRNQVEAYIDEVGGVQPVDLTADGTQARSVLTDVRGKVTALGRMVAQVLIDANTNPAQGKIAAIKRELASIRDEDVYINVRKVNAGGMGPQATSNNAEGGYISGPGTATSDSIPARLSNGEYVIQAKAVERYGVAMFDHLNAQRFANGGLVSAPLFTDEGPRFYKAAYRHNKPFAKSGPASWPSPYQTTLSAADEALFEAWVASAGVPFDPFSRLTDYDMRGFWKRTQGAGWAEGSHFPDTYKTPYDTTFSHESKYATANNPFYWHGNSLIDQRNGQVVFAADGATVPKTGRGYADRHLYMLADGEEVISNRYGQADRFRSDRANGLIPGYADGGTAGKKKARAGQRASRALGNLGVDLSVDANGASDALGKFTDDVDHIRDLFKDAGRKWSKSLDEQTDAIRKSARQFDSLNTTLTTARNDRASYAGTVGSSLGGSLFGNGLAGFQAAADANTADYSAAQGGLAAAIANGLDGPLRDALAESGDINALTQFGGLNAAQISVEEQRYAKLQGAQSGFGNVAAGARYDGDIAKASLALAKETRELRAELKQLGKRVEQGARDGTHSGTAQANNTANTTTAQDTRTTGRGGGHRGGR